MQFGKTIIVTLVTALTLMTFPQQARAANHGDVALGVLGGVLIGGLIGYNLSHDDETVVRESSSSCQREDNSCGRDRVIRNRQVRTERVRRGSCDCQMTYMRNAFGQMVPVLIDFGNDCSQEGRQIITKETSDSVRRDTYVFTGDVHVPHSIEYQQQIQIGKSGSCHSCSTGGDSSTRQSQTEAVTTQTMTYDGPVYGGSTYQDKNSTTTESKSGTQQSIDRKSSQPSCIGESCQSAYFKKCGEYRKQVPDLRAHYTVYEDYLCGQYVSDDTTAYDSSTFEDANGRQFTANNQALYECRRKGFTAAQCHPLVLQGKVVPQECGI